MEILNKRINLALASFLLLTVLVGCGSNDVELPAEDNSSDHKGNSTNEDESTPKSEEDNPPEKESELPKDPIPKDEVDQKGTTNNSSGDSYEEKDSPVDEESDN
ncbi:hypothetical protein ACTWPF_15310 [Oceanobacillus sp. M65]|uniref:hypothetical protein n=1 Tax=Oceanobacillus sp. M65 TaxID=3457435 RepID=UPI003FCE3334